MMFFQNFKSARTSFGAQSQEYDFVSKGYLMIGVYLLINSSRLAFSKIKLTRGEICVSKFIPPPANDASLGSYLVKKYRGMGIFLSVKFATSLLPLLAGHKTN